VGQNKGLSKAYTTNQGHQEALKYRRHGSTRGKEWEKRMREVSPNERSLSTKKEKKRSDKTKDLIQRRQLPRRNLGRNALLVLIAILMETWKCQSKGGKSERKRRTTMGRLTATSRKFFNPRSTATKK